MPRLSPFSTAACALGLVTSTGLTQAPRLVKDITITDAGPLVGRPDVARGKFDRTALPRSFLQLGSHWYFAAQNELGLELWKSDGTPKGTVLVKDIRPGLLSSRPADLTLSGSSIFFTASASDTGMELWRSDGTSAGTHLVKDLVAGPESATPTHLHAIGSGLVFTRLPWLETEGLYHSDGTANGTKLLMNLRRVTRFVARDATTAMFGAEDASSVAGLWSTNGTANGTRLVKAVGSVRQLTRFGPVVLFVARTTHGLELWRSDGTAAGTLPVVDPNASSRPLDPLLDPGGLHGGDFYFAANDKELWKTDGTSKGTVLVQRVGGSFDRPTIFTLWKNEMYFSAGGLWKSDGTSAGTVQVTSVRPTDLEAFGNKLVLANFGDIYTTDGTASGTSLVKKLDAPVHVPNGFTLMGSKLVFSASDSTVGNELFETDGTTSGTKLFVDLYPGRATQSTEIESLCDHHGTVFFEASSPQYGRELWKSDGTAAGTMLVKDILPGTASGQAISITSFGEHVYFGAAGGLWKSDGTAAGTVLVSNVALPRYVPRSMIVYRGKLYFAGLASASVGTELYCSDGTAAGTKLVRDIYAGNGSSTPQHFAVYDGKLYFQANEPTVRRELFVTDGTSAGTKLFKDLSSFDAAPTFLTVHRGRLYFSACSNGNGCELHVTDGTLVGTKAIALNPPSGSAPSRLVSTDSGLFFAAEIGRYGREPYFSDGTVAGTKLIADIFPGIGDSMSYGNSEPAFLGIGKRAWFLAAAGWSTPQYFTSDGSAAGSTPVLFGASSRSQSVLSKGMIFCAGYDPKVGQELYVWPTSLASARAIGHSCGPSFPELHWTAPVLGTTAYVSGRGHASQPGLLLLNAPAAPARFGSCFDYVDVQSAFVLGPIVGPSFRHPIGIPVDSALAHVRVHTQAFFVTLPGVLPIVTSNAVQLQLGY